jgi:hypothetical protein
VEAALNALQTADPVTDLTAAHGRDSIRGRIDATLCRVSSAEDIELNDCAPTPRAPRRPPQPSKTNSTMTTTVSSSPHAV